MSSSSETGLKAQYFRGLFLLVLIIILHLFPPRLTFTSLNIRQGCERGGGVAFFLLFHM